MPTSVLHYGRDFASHVAQNMVKASLFVDKAQISTKGATMLTADKFTLSFITVVSYFKESLNNANK